MRLIDLDAKEPYLLDGRYAVGVLDNAPTVEERPQGEWNYIQAGMCVCPFCGAMPHKKYKNFCAKCGAYMRKGSKNETDN